MRKRGKLVGNKKLTEEYLNEIGYKSLDDLAEAIHKTSDCIDLGGIVIPLVAVIQVRLFRPHVKAGKAHTTALF